MKINELYEATAKLGFLDSLEDISAFFSAANRATLQINALRPLTAILEIYHRRPENLIAGANHDIYERSKEDLIFETSDPARAYYFEVNGEGVCAIEVFENGEWHPKGNVDFNTRVYKSYKAFIEDDKSRSNGRVRLRFTGGYAFHVRNAAVWDVLYSSSEEDIPSFEKYVRYDLRQLADDFIELADNPYVDSFERINKNYLFESGSILLLPGEIAREVKIKYKKRPRTLVYTDDPQKDITEIELDPELSELLPLLTAVYVLADEGDGKSQFYYQLYLQRAQEIEAKRRNRENAEYLNVNGW